MRRVCSVCAACLCLVLIAGRAIAGQASAAGSIIGQVKDESGAVLPGVTVTAKSPALQVAAVVSVTDPQGEYRLTPLPIGVYTVDYELQGFQTLRQQDVRITTGFVARLDVRLNIGTVTETVTVSGEAPLVDVTSTTTVTRFTKETLEVLPTNRNGLNSLLVQAPGARGTMEAGGKISFSPPTIRVFGQAGEPWYVLEGIYTPSPDNGGGLGNYWDYNSIEEAAVQTMATNAEVGGRGAFVSGVVKSGGNDFHGGMNWAYMSDKLSWNNIDERLAAQGITRGDTVLARYDLGMDLGGRIIRDKLWFYGAVRDRQNYFDVIGATPPPGERNYQNQRGNWTAKASYQMSAANKFIGYITQNRRGQETMSQFVPWGSRTDSPLWPTIYKLEWQSVRGNSLVTSVQLGRWGYVSPPRNTVERGEQLGSPFDQGPSRIDNFTQMTSGANGSVGRSWDVHRYNPRAVVTWYKPNSFMGNHEIKSGVDLFYDYDTSPRQARQYNYRLIFNNAAALQIQTYNSPVAPLEKQNDYAAYVQDTWTIRRRLTLNLGLRYNHENAYIPASCREAATPPADVLFPAACFDKIQFNLLNQMSPRIRAAYDVTGDGRTVIKGGWGRYYYRRVIEGDVSYADPNNFVTATYRWRDSNGNADYDAGEVNWNPNGPDFISTSGEVNTIVNPDEKVPIDDEFSATLERQIGSSMGLRVTSVYSLRRHPYRLTNLLRPPSAYSIPVTVADPGPDGRLNTGDDTGNTVTYYNYPATLSGRAFERFMRINDPAGNQSYGSIDVAINKRFSNRWHAAGGYSATRTRAPLGSGQVVAAHNPNAEIFPSDDTWEWLGHLSGSYLLPADVTLSAVFEHRSGTPQARTANFTSTVLGTLALRVEPIGSIRLPDTRSLDLRAEKSFTLRSQHKAKVRLNLYNVFNANTVTSQTVSSGAAFGRPTAIMGPRVAEVSLVWTF
jgi:hypothetical protein